MTTTDRRALHAFVSDEAHSQWHDFAAEQGVSVSALLEALAPELRLLSKRGEAIVKAARKIDAERRRRRRH